MLHPDLHDEMLDFGSVLKWDESFGSLGRGKVYFACTMIVNTVARGQTMGD